MNNVTQKDDIKDGMQKYLKPREQHSVAIESKLDPSGSCIWYVAVGIDVLTGERMQILVQIRSHSTPV